jgi:hypothetical protein
MLQSVGAVISFYALAKENPKAEFGGFRSDTRRKGYFGAAPVAPFGSRCLAGVGDWGRKLNRDLIGIGWGILAKWSQFTSQDLHVLWGADAQANRVPFDTNDLNFNSPIDQNGFFNPSRQYQHSNLLNSCVLYDPFVR